MRASLRFIFRKIWTEDPGMYALIFLYTLAFSLSPFVWVIAPKWIIDLGLAGRTETLVFVALGTGLVSALLQFSTNSLQGNYRMRMNQVRYALFRDFFRSVLQLPYEDNLVPERRSEVHLHRMVLSSPYAGIGACVRILLGLFGYLIASLGLLALMAQLSLPITVALLALVLGIFYAQNKAESYESSQIVPFYEAWRQYSHVLDLSHENDGLFDLRLYGFFGLLQHYAKHQAQQLQALVFAIRQKHWHASLWIAGLEVLKDALLFGTLLLRFAKGQLPPGDFFMYSTGLATLFVILRESMKEAALFFRHLKRITGYREWLNRQEEARRDEGKKAAEILKAHGLKEAPLPKHGPALEIRGLSFRYPGSEQPIFEDFHLTIQAGEKLALVGENAAGKSTLVHLLCRLYQPQKGEILIDGIPIMAYEETAYRRLLAVVFQDAQLFPFTAAENIAMVDKAPADRLAKASQDAGFDKVASGLKAGLETPLLRTLDDTGVDLSGGQRQSLFLARALYRQAPILLLDEPTAALDPLAEHALYQAYHALSKDKTCLFISHRLASTRFCSRILFLEKGKIIEEGSHESLMAKGGAYHDLFQVQAQYYQAERSQPCVPSSL